MKKLFLAAASTVLVGQASYATVYFSDTFDTYVNGNLAGTSQDAVGQGPWRQTNTSATNPVQVNNGAVVLGTSGQDVYAPLNSTLTLNDGSSFYIGVDVNLTSAQSAGDYFLHWTPTVGNTGTFQERLFAKSSGAGYVLGYTSSTGTAVYGTTVLNFGSDYRLVLNYTGVAGSTPANDTFALYVNPADTTTEGNNTAYLSGGYVGTGAETETVAGINLRQGTAANAPAETVDNLNVANTFGEAAVFTAAPVPEPAVVALLGLGGLGLLVRRKIKA